MSIKITCINKDNGYHANPNLAITHLGWINEIDQKTGKNTRLEIYSWIKNENGYAYMLQTDAEIKQKLLLRKPLMVLNI
ncbi:hypothetical protein [uncultured Chryseobacterium sp.]|uniref:hypothetical protein n=1 Tax=uncultured Chryseobacterium sp. TaxID=259322 RepID=UPI0025E2AF76|nr:hypothetical protein [uncultured Chryseobacterium sp.]